MPSILQYRRLGKQLEHEYGQQKSRSNSTAESTAVGSRTSDVEAQASEEVNKPEKEQTDDTFIVRFDGSDDMLNEP
jgi:hypothetical protein